MGLRLGRSFWMVRGCEKGKVIEGRFQSREGFDSVVLDLFSGG